MGADQIEIAAGVYMPGPDELLGLRQHISGHFEEFSKLAGDKAVTKLMGELQGDSLARPPKGFAADDPAIEWIKKKQWYYYKTDLDLGLALTPKLPPEIVKRRRQWLPFSIADWRRAAILVTREGQIVVLMIFAHPSIDRRDGGFLFMTHYRLLEQ